MTLTRLAEICEATGDESSMEKYLKHGLSAVGDGVRDVCAVVRQAYGGICARQSAWDDAELSLLRALDVWNQLGQQERMVEVRLLLANMYRQQKRWTKARRELESAREKFREMPEPRWLVFSGQTDDAEAQFLWDRGECAAAVKIWERLEMVYRKLGQHQNELSETATRASSVLVMAFATEGQFQSAFGQAERTLAMLSLDCPRDAETKAQVLRHLSPAAPEHADAVDALLESVKTSLPHDATFAPLWATVHSMEAQLAASKNHWENVAAAVRDAIRWALDAELAATRRWVLDTLTEPTYQMREQAPDIAGSLRANLSEFIENHPPPPYRHLWKPVPDWLGFVMGIRVRIVE